MSKSLRILILEDSPADSELVQFELQDAGFIFTPKVVMTEEDFILGLREFSPDLILSDYDLPKYNGALALAEAKRRCPEIPFILVIGAVTEDRAIDILTQGAKDYVLKHRLQQRLVPAVQSALVEAEDHRARKQAEAELREAHKVLAEQVEERTAALQSSEILYHSLFDNMLDGFAYCRMIYDQGRPLDFIYLDVNKSFESLTGLKNVIGKRVSEVIPGIQDSDPKLLEIYGRVALTGKTERFEWYINVLKMWFSVSVYSPAKEHFVAIFDVISARKLAEEALQDSEKRYRRLFESAKDGILILDADTGKVDDVNPFLLQLLGYSYDALYGKHIWELGVFKDIAASKEAFKVLQDNEYIRYDDLPLETVDGQIIAVEFVSNVYLVDHHKVIQCNIRDITAQKQVKEEKEQILNNLQEEKDRLQALINGINDEIWLADTQKQFTLANPSALHEFGLNSDADAIDIQKFAESLEVYRPDGSTRPVEEAPPLRALKGEVVKNQEEMVRTPAIGEIRHRQVSSNPIRDASGQIIGSVSVVRDITERKKMEDALRISEERFSKAFKNSPNAITITRISDGKIIEGNDSVYDLLGYDHDEVVGKTTFDLGIWADVDERAKLTQGLATKGFIRNKEFTLLKKDRTPVIVDLSASLINIDNQQCFMASFIDITERKQTEEALKESEKKYRELVKYAPVGIYEIDFRNRKFVTVNDVMILLTGYTREELLSMDVLDLLHDESKKAFTARISKMLKGEKPDENVEYKVKAKDGHIIYAVLNVSFKVDEQGIPIGATVIGHDITNRKQMEKTLIQATQRAEYNQLLLESIIQQMPAGVIIADTSGTVAKNNEAMDRIWRREMLPTENIEDHGYVAYHEDGREYILEEWPLTRALRDGEIIVGEEMVILRGDGTKGVVHVSSAPIRDKTGQIIAGVVIDVDITERKQAEDALKKSEDRLHFALETIHTGAWDLDLVDHSAFRSIEHDRIFGYSQLLPEWTYEIFLAHVFPEDRAMVDGKFRQAIENKSDWGFECRINRIDGQVRWIWAAGRYTQNATGDTHCMAGIIQDITERKQAQEALRLSEEKFSIAFANNPAAIALSRLDDGLILEVNDTWVVLNGYSREEAIGYSARRMGIWPNAETTTRFVQELQKNGFLHGWEQEFRRKSGEVFVAQLSAQLLTVRDEKIILSTLVDITERKQREKEQDKLNRTLRALKKSNEAMIQATNESAYMEEICKIVVGECGHTMVWIGFAEDDESKTVCPVAYSGFEQGYIDALKITWADTERGRGPTGTAIREGEIRTCRNMLTDPLFKPWREEALKRGYASSIVLPLISDNKTFGALTIYSREPDPFTKDEVTLLTELASDLSYGIMAIRLRVARSKAEEALNERTVQLENANKELESFSYSVSHDLKAPLRAIEGYSRMLLKKDLDKLSDDAIRKLDVIRSNTAKMNVLIDDLLSFSRVLKSSIVISEINMDKLVNEVWAEIREANTERELELKIENLVPGKGDPILIRQILVNLISNAVKYTKTRKPGIIKMGCYRENGHVVYFIKDNGVGFDMAYYSKLFGVFQRLHSQEEYEGTGVGLAIVHRIIVRHGGRIWAEGEVDKGATFYFTLPTSRE